ncbi:retrovirus-related pol polyprotein from transposon TNT 1-94 [Tanacetum coccineum]
MTNNINHLKEIVDQAWVKHSNDLLHLRNPTAQDMEILVKTCLMPLALKTQNDSFAFVHELKQEMHADLKYVESLEDELDELESDRDSSQNLNVSRPTTLGAKSNEDKVVGTEFLNKTLNAFFKEEGIEHQTSTPRTPEQNGVVERRNRTLVEAARTMLLASKLPLFFWAEAIATACYTQNRSNSSYY